MRRLAGLLVALVIVLTGTAPGRAATPYLMTDHPAWTGPDASYAWAREALDHVIAWDIFRGVVTGDRSRDYVTRDVAEVFRYESETSKELKALASTYLELPKAPAFRPEGTISRAEFATLLARATGLDSQYKPGGTIPFRDVKATDWYIQNLMPLFQHNIVRLDDLYLDTFEPAKPITRGLIAAWVARAAAAVKVSVTGMPLAFTDIPPRYQYTRELEQAVALGIIKGYPQEDGTLVFRPENTATRAEAAAMVYRLIPKLVWAPPTVDTLHTSIQEAFDVLGLYMREHREPIPDQEEFKRIFGRYYTAPNLEWWVGDSTAPAGCHGTYPPYVYLANRPYNKEMGLLCGAPSGEGWAAQRTGNQALTLLTAHIRNRQDSDVWYQSTTVLEVAPFMVTDRFAKVEVLYFRKLYRPTAFTDFSTARFREMVYLKLEGGRWKLSSVGSRREERDLLEDQQYENRLDGMQLADFIGGVR